MFHPDGPTFWELGRQALSSTERGYDLLAPKFDYTPFRTPLEILQTVEGVLRELGPVDSAVDLCCGTGAAMTVLQPFCRRIVGVDFSKGMLATASRNLPQSANSAWELIHGDVLDMQFVDEFDLATFFGGNGHILPKDQPQFLNRVWRSLRVGGRFVFVTAPTPSRISKRYWVSQVFNFGMRLRNRMFRPPFIMYYLLFLLPDVLPLLRNCGFEVSIRNGLFAPPFNDFAVVVATKLRHNGGAGVGSTYRNPTQVV